MRFIKTVLVVLLVVGVSVGLSSIAQDQKTILRVNFAWPTFIDPAVGSDFSSASSMINLYDSLVYPNSAGGVDPSIAESWESTPDGLSWTFHLRQDATFHDGGALTAEDVAFSMNRMLAIGEGFAPLFVGRVEGAEALDATTVRFTLAQPFGPFLTSLARLYILSKACVLANMKTPGDFGEFGDYAKDYLLTNDCGSGAYQVNEFKLEEFLLMDKFEGYWGELAERAPDQVRYTGVSDPVTVRTLMERNELEISDQWLPLEQFSALDSVEGIDIGSWVSGSMLYMMLNNRIAPTDDIHFRRALSWVLDYETVVTSIFPGTQQARGPVTSNLPGFDPTVFQYHQDLDMARRELALSDYDGETITFFWTAEVPDLEKIALSFQADADEVGIDVEIVKTPWLNMIEASSTQDSTPHIMIIWVAPDFPEAGSLLELRYHSNRAAGWEQAEWLMDPVIDSLIDDAISTSDVEERFAKYGLLQAVIADLAPSIFVYEQLERHAYQSAFVSWPQLENPIAVMGYNMAARFIEVFPEGR